MRIFKMQLTDEQRQRIAKNKAEALRKAAERKAREATSRKPEMMQATTSSVQPKTVLAMNRANFSKQPFSSNQSSMNAFVKRKIPADNSNIPKANIDVEFKIISEKRFKVEFYPFHSSIIDVLKRIPSRNYDPSTRSWTFSIEDSSNVSESLKNEKSVDVHLKGIPYNVINLLNYKPKIVPADLKSVMDPELIKKLFAYQVEGVIFALERDGRVLLADEMGLGKSLQALTIARYYKSDWPLLIVCPSSVKGSWKKQINLFFPAIHRIFLIEKGSDPLPDVRTSNTVAIMSYEQMLIKYDELRKEKYQTIIFDESHMLKDSKAKRTKVATDLSKIASHVVLLSGTPALSRPAELFSQIRMVDSSLFPNFTDFAIRYCDGKQGRFCFEAKGCSNSEELAAIMFKRLMIRRLKADVLKDLPEKRREVVYVSGPTIDERMGDLQKAKAAYDRVHATDFSRSHDCLLEFYSLTGIVKAAAVSDHILENYFYPDAPPRKVLIFAHHQIVLDTIQHEVNKRKLESIRIDGKTPSQQRTLHCNEFQNNDNVRVAILSLTAAGVGITLTAASVVVFAEIHFNPGILVQAEDRAHRVGQKDSVFVQYLIAKNTADDVMWNMVQKKLDILGQVSLSSDTFRTAEKTHIRFNDPSQPSMKQYIDVANEENEWRDPCEDDDDTIKSLESPVAKRTRL